MYLGDPRRPHAGRRLDAPYELRFAEGSPLLPQPPTHGLPGLQRIDLSVA